MIIDTHAHYDDKAFAEDYENIIGQFPEAGIGWVVDVGSTLESIAKVRQLADTHDNIYGALGIHPSECAPMTDADLASIEAQIVSDPKIVAVGEIGLDYYWLGKDDATPDKDIQAHWFREQIRMAIRIGKPIIVHSRDAAQDTMTILKEEHAEQCGGVIHCYSYSKELAMEFIDMGFFIGLGGVVTFKNARKAKEVVATIPMERLVLETDCPYMAPTPHRGERNSSLYLPLVVSEIARIRGIAEQDVIDITYSNACKLYHLQERRV